MAGRATRAVVPLGTSLLFHAALAVFLLAVAVRPRPVPQVPLQIQVVDVPPKPPPEPVKPAEPPPPPPPVPMKVARAPRAAPKNLPPPTPMPLPPSSAPPPPTTEAPQSSKEPVVITGITLESTSQGGSMAVGTGNTLRGTPERTARAPETVKPYKAEQYAPAAQVSELPQPLNRESLNLRKYYPPQAKKDGFEGDVVLRLLIDSDGTIAKVDVISDPGQGLGPAAAQAVRELRFSPAKVNGVPVATTVPFTIHFTLD
ncbi:MAG TPA: energy transducer TonB [Myxococcales bacterium]|nr:energy transducer TonB [Myxococcales bacterium]